MSVVASISLAVICIAHQCYPALMGKDTPVGQFEMYRAQITEPGYGGDVLVFKDMPNGVPFAVHRVYTRIPSQRRSERLRGPVEGRRGITGGCINVEVDVYDKIPPGPLTIIP